MTDAEKLKFLRDEVRIGAEQAESGKFSKHTVDSLLKVLNRDAVPPVITEGYYTETKIRS